MKKYLFLFIGGILFSCSNANETSTEVDTPEIVSNFLNNTKSLQRLELKKPIQSFTTAANNSALDKMSVEKGNIKAVFEKLDVYTYCVILTGEHTLVKFSGLEDCKQSGSWGACMPKGEGYIKKGKLVYQKDYINNIIGLPDNQKRVAYFFN